MAVCVYTCLFHWVYVCECDYKSLSTLPVPSCMSVCVHDMSPLSVYCGLSPTHVSDYIGSAVSPSTGEMEREPGTRLPLLGVNKAMLHLNSSSTYTGLVEQCRREPYSFFFIWSRPGCRGCSFRRFF